jgi:hypothetical protein
MLTVLDNPVARINGYIYGAGLIDVVMVNIMFLFLLRKYHKGGPCGEMVRHLGLNLGSRPPS